MEFTGNKILFRPLPSNEVSQAGLYIPENAREISNKGIIVKTGAGTDKKLMRLKEGTVAYRVKDWGNEVEIDGQLHFIMDEQAIIATE